jgi:predicted dinucleotide-binding enzyme
MKIGILGCGNLGATLGQFWSQAGHEVLFASSHPSKSEALARQHQARSGSYCQVIEECPTLLYSLRQVPPRQLNPGRWAGKTVIDCNQADLPLGFDFRPRSKSLAQQLADDLPMCQVVKAFCLHPVELYHHGAETLRTWGVQSFYCGGQPEDKAVVRQLALDLGLLPFDCGPLSRAYLLEAQADFWRLFQLHQGQALVSQFQLVGYPEPAEFQRQPGFDWHASADPKPLPTRESEAEVPPE